MATVSLALRVGKVTQAAHLLIYNKDYFRQTVEVMKQGCS